jgi:hypothetical protein
MYAAKAFCANKNYAAEEYHTAVSQKLFSFFFIRYAQCQKT